MPESAGAKTLSLLLLIALGVWLKRKLPPEQVKGLKTLILAVALPATIFLALMQIEVRKELLWLPVLALGYNLLMLGVGWLGLRWHPLGQDAARRRTLLMLFPSLAPGLSCFPFLVEFLGEESLAQAAIADVGNKIFVLILLYLLAMRWYYGTQPAADRSGSGRLKSLGLALLREPINLVMVLALGLLGLGWQLDDLPGFLQSTVVRLGAIMTPLVLLFIGLAVKVKRKDIWPILSLLLMRSGIALLFSATLLFLLPGLSPVMGMLAIVFPQSAVSFWPYAHMSAVQAMEDERSSTFDLNLGVNILAFSLPFSTLLILSFVTAGPALVQPWVLMVLGMGALVLGILPTWIASVGASSNSPAEVVVAEQEA